MRYSPVHPRFGHGADGDPAQLETGCAHGLEHPLHLVVLPLVDPHLEPALFSASNDLTPSTFIRSPSTRTPRAAFRVRSSGSPQLAAVHAGHS